MKTDRFESARERMVSEQMVARGIHDSRVLDAMRGVPRQEFVPPDHVDEAYADSPLLIGEEQTISQPYIVGLMTEMLDLRPDFRVLEIGTGSGYQTAVLAEIVAEVLTVEVREGLLDGARRCLDRLGYSNVRFRYADGWDGWSGFAPFDRIIVTACAPRVPPRLVEQLSPGGIMVLPLEREGGEQVLSVVTRREGFGIDIRERIPVRFVPMTSSTSREEAER